MKKKTTILSIFLAAFMALALNVGQVKAAATGQDIVNYAMRFRGVPYVAEGDDPSGFDCSGFVQYVYRNAAGINLPRSTYGQIKVGTPVSRNELQPGDLVFPHTGHVGIYVGNGEMIHSPQTGDVVKVAPVYAFYAGRRIITDYCEGVDTNASPIKRGYRVCVSSVNVKRCASDSSQTLKTLNYGYVVDIYKEYGDWYLIARGSTAQWVRKNTLEEVNTNVKPMKRGYRVSVSSAAVKNTPSDSGSTFKTLNYGYVLDIYGEFGDWYLVARGTTQQWIKKSNLEEITTNVSPMKRGYKISVSSAAVKNTPSDSAPTYKTLNYGYELDIYGEFGDWYLVARGDTQQWVKKNCVSPI